jgi:hypothetical protein
MRDADNSRAKGRVKKAVQASTAHHHQHPSFSSLLQSLPTQLRMNNHFPHILGRQALIWENWALFGECPQANADADSFGEDD